MQKDQQPPWVRAYRQAVGERIRERRRELGLTQIQLCYAARVDRTTYQLIERGQSDPHLGDLALIAQQLQTTVADLVTQPRP